MQKKDFSLNPDIYCYFEYA